MKLIGILYESRKIFSCKQSHSVGFRSPGHRAHIRKQQDSIGSPLDSNTKTIKLLYGEQYVSMGSHNHRVLHCLRTYAMPHRRPLNSYTKAIRFPRGGSRIQLDSHIKTVGFYRACVLNYVYRIHQETNSISHTTVMRFL